MSGPLGQTTRAAVLEAFGEPLVVRDQPIPEHLESGSLLVEVERATICGSDLHLCDGSMRATLGDSLPVIPGHEMVGRIVSFADGAELDSMGAALSLGDRVIWSHGSCGNCRACNLLHDETVCERRRWYMFTPCDRYPYLVGGFAEHCYVFPESGRIRVPDEIPSEWASAASCALRSVVHAFERLGKVEPWQSVVVQGAGPLGLFASAIASAAGAGRVVVIGAPKERLEIALRWGADEAISIEELADPEQRLAAVMDATGGRGADVVMEFSGAPTAVDEGLRMCAIGARYIVAGQTGGFEHPIRGSIIARSNIDVRGSWSGDIGHYWKALATMQALSPRVDFSALFGPRAYTLDEINEAMGQMRSLAEVKPVIAISG